MFRGIQVSRRHTNFQRFLWLKNENEPMLHFRLLTVTYGLAPSPFLTVRVLKQLAGDHRLEYPASSQALSRDAYVDDIPTGCDSVEDLSVLKTELIGLLGKRISNYGNGALTAGTFCNHYLKMIDVMTQYSSAQSFTHGVARQGPWSRCNVRQTYGIRSQHCPHETITVIATFQDPTPTTVLLKLIFQESLS